MSSDLALQEIPFAERNNRQKPEEDKEASSQTASLSRKTSKKYGAERASIPHKTQPKLQSGASSHRGSIASKRGTRVPKLNHASSISSVMTSSTATLVPPLTNRASQPERQMYRNAQYASSTRKVKPS